MSCLYRGSNPGPSRPQPSRDTEQAAPASRMSPDTVYFSPQPWSPRLEDTFQFSSPIYAQIFQVVCSFMFIRPKCSYTSYLLARVTFTTHLIPLRFPALSSVPCRAQIIKFLIMQSPSPSSQCLFLSSKYSRQHIIIKQPQTTLSVSLRDQVTHPFGPRNNRLLHA